MNNITEQFDPSALTGIVSDNALAISWCAIDETTQQHSSELYWRWRKVFEQDKTARIIEHPDYVLNDADLSSTNTGWLGFCSEGEHDIAVAVLVPKVINTRNAGSMGLHWNLQGYRLVGDRILGDQQEETLNLLAEAVPEKLQSEINCDFLLIEDLEENSTFWNAIQRTSGRGCHIFSPTSIQKRYSLELPETAEAYWGSFTSKTRGKLRRRRKSLQKAGEVALHVYESVKDITDFLEQAHQVSLKTWQTHQLGLRIKNDEQELKLFTFLSEHDAFRSFVLTLDDKPVAFIVGNQYNGTFHHEEIGYDADLRKLSPGQVLLGMVIDEFYSHNRPAAIDFGLGDAEYKQIMSNRETQSGTLWLMPRRLKMRSTLNWLKLSLFFRHSAKRLLKSTGLFTRLKKLLRKPVSGQKGGA